MDNTDIGKEALRRYPEVNSSKDEYAYDRFLEGASWVYTQLQSRLSECERERDELRKEMDAIKDAIEGNPETLNQLRKDEHFTEDKANKFIEPEKVLFAIWALARMLHGTLQTMHSKECLNEIRELTKLKQ
jgi:chromosome segregation ATPase